MPQERFEVRVPLTRLLAGLCATIVPICVVGIYTATQAERTLNRQVGTHFQTIASATASEVARFINDRVVAVGALAGDPTLLETVEAANRSYAGQSDAAVRARIQKMENDWNKPAAEAFVKGVLSNRASRLLRRYWELDRRFLRLTLTDAHGAVVAATHKTLDYYQADEDYWQKIYAEGRGAAHLTDVLYDEVSKTHYIGVGMPLTAEGTGSFLGTLDALIEVSQVGAVVHAVQFGPAGRSLLLKADGTVIAAPNVSLASNVKSEEWAALGDAQGGNLAGQAGFHSVILRGGKKVMAGFADTGLQEHFPNLGWSVVVVQDADQAFAATRGAIRLIFVMAAVGLAMVTLLAVWFSLHRRREYTDIASAAAAR